jgi:two-component system, sensor histidine kinase and response regulator
LLGELAALFLQECPQMQAEIQAALNRGDAKVVERAAHSLKGSVANFGAKRIVDLAFQIEMLGKKGDLAAVPEVLTQLNATLAVLAPELGQR